MFLLNSFFKLRYPNVKSVPEIGSDDWPKMNSLSPHGDIEHDAMSSVKAVYITTTG